MTERAKASEDCHCGRCRPTRVQPAEAWLSPQALWHSVPKAQDGCVDTLCHTGSIIHAMFRSCRFYYDERSEE